MKTITLSILLLLAASQSLAATRYVSDIIYVPVRSGAGNEYRIIFSKLRTGMVVEQFETSADGLWARIETAGGTSGWVETQYLLEQPTARQQMDATKAQLAKTREDAESLQEQYTKLLAEHEKLVQAMNVSSAERDSFEEELVNLKTLSADAINLNERYRELLAKHELMQTECDALQAENDRLKADKVITHWLVGAGMVLFGMILMLIMPAIIPKKRNSDWAN